MPFSVPAAALIFLTLLGVILLPGCSDGKPPGSGSWVVERDTIGDTIVVRTISGSVWGKPATLVEELTIGVLEGPDELMFGFIQAMSVDDEGGIYVFDGQVPALRYFDRKGKYVRTLGREGSGPGEYRRSAWGLSVRRDGKVVMLDFQNARLNVFEPDGRWAGEWPVASVPYSLPALTLDTADHAYLRIRLGPYRRDKPTRAGLLHLDPNGEIIDTIPAPQIEGEPQSAPWLFWPSKQWAWSPLGYMVVGLNRDYSFDVRPPGRPVVRIERVVEPVELHPEERANYQARDKWMREHGVIVLGAEMRPVPERKPPYRTLRVGERGRIWVHRHTVAEEVEGRLAADPNRPPPITWREPTVYDVFEPNGTYLGEVHLPRGTRAYVFRGDTVWGVRTGAFDEQYVVRLVVSREGSPGE